MDIKSDLLTTGETAALLRTTSRSLATSRCTRRSTLHFIKLGRRVLYHRADIENWLAMGLPATTSGGSTSWRPDHAEVLAGKDVCLIPDSNSAGEKYKETVCRSLHGKVASLKVVSIAPHPDFRRWADAGGTLERIFELWGDAPEWQPATGAEILDSVFSFIQRFVSLTEAQSRAATLWTAHSHAVEAATFTPYLRVCSAHKQEGKSRLCEVLRTRTRLPFDLRTLAAHALSCALFPLARRKKWEAHARRFGLGVN